jgi:GNAT superfamily N-acetyltransferase
MTQATLARSSRHDLIFVDAALARRMEAAEEYGDLRPTEVLMRTRPELGCAFERIGGGTMSFSGKDSPVGRAHGLGFFSPITDAVLDHVEEFYRSRGVPSQIDVCPYTHPSMLEQLKNRGYAIQEFNMILSRYVYADEDFSVPTGVTVRVPRPDEIKEISQIVDRGFGDGKAMGFAWLFETWLEVAGNLTLVAEVDGKIAGGASGLIVKEHNMAAFFGASTLPAFRKRGVQTALFLKRLEMAREAGCDLAVTLTLPGTTSQRNAERVGFRVAFTKAVAIKTFQPA